MLSNSARVLSALFSYGFDNQASAAQPAPVEMVQCELRELLIVVAITVQLSV